MQGFFQAVFIDLFLIFNFFRLEEHWSLNLLASPVSRNLCRPFPPLHHPVMTAWARCQALNLDSPVKVKKSDRKCASTASQRDILPAVCEHLKAAPRCNRRCERRWAGCALHFNYHLCANIRQRLASFTGNQCFLIFSPVCSNTSKDFIWISPALTLVKTSK